MQQEDIEFDKQLDNLIDESIKKGYDDEKIIDTVLSGGKNTLNPKDVRRYEEMEFQELRKKIRAEGQVVPKLEDMEVEDQ